jgi:hypothetical protein
VVAVAAVVTWVNQAELEPEVLPAVVQQLVKTVQTPVVILHPVVAVVGVHLWVVTTEPAQAAAVVIQPGMVKV